MPDTRRELAAIQALFADNTAGDISAQDARDANETAHPAKVVQAGAYSALPSSGRVTGDLYLPTDAPIVERFDGTAFRPWGPLFNFTRPVDGDFAWVNQGTATVAAAGGGIVLNAPATTSHQLRLRKKAAPATPYTITACFLHNSIGVNFQEVGLAFRQSSDGKLHTFNLDCQTRTIASFKWTNASTFSASYTSAPIIAGNLLWFRIADNGTNRICSFSADGVNFDAFHSIGRTDFLTADEVGFYADPGASAGLTMTLLSWKEA